MFHVDPGAIFHLRWSCLKVKQLAWIRIPPALPDPTAARESFLCLWPCPLSPWHTGVLVMMILCLNVPLLIHLWDLFMRWRSIVQYMDWLTKSCFLKTFFVSVAWQSFNLIRYLIQKSCPKSVNEVQSKVRSTLPPEQIQPDFSVTRLFAFDSWCTHIWHEFYQISKKINEPFLRNRVFWVIFTQPHQIWLFARVFGPFFAIRNYH